MKSINGDLRPVSGMVEVAGAVEGVRRTRKSACVHAAPRSETSSTMESTGAVEPTATMESASALTPREKRGRQHHARSHQPGTSHVPIIVLFRFGGL